MRRTRNRIVVAYALAVIATTATRVSADVVDFSTVPGGPFDQVSFAREGVIFTIGDYVAWVQGDEGLLGPVAGNFTVPATRLTATFAPGLQGTADYTLSAFNVASELIASSTIRVTQDLGDVADTGFGHIALGLGLLPHPAASFALTNRFVRSSYPHVHHVPFAVSSLEFTPVPEPGTLILLLGAGAALLSRRTRSWSGPPR